MSWGSGIAIGWAAVDTSESVGKLLKETSTTENNEKESGEGENDITVLEEATLVLPLTTLCEWCTGQWMYNSLAWEYQQMF